MARHQDGERPEAQPLAHTLQQDLFFSAPTLSIAKPHPHNHRCLLHEDCHWEKHEAGKGSYWEIGVGRTEDGYFSAFGYRDNIGGCGGPVFIVGAAYHDFSSARLAAIESLLARMEVCYDSQAAASRERLAASIRAAAGLGRRAG